MRSRKSSECSNGLAMPVRGGATIGGMRKLLTWLVVTLGIAALVRKLRRREESVEIAPAAPTEDPAQELRRKLDETREEEPAATAPSPAADASVEERRAEVHEQGRTTLQEMQPSEGAPESQSQEP
jgi:hypothetical protein